MESLAPDEGYDDLLDAIEAGTGSFLTCSNGHGSLPPRAVCPVCGDGELTATPLPREGRVRSYTVIHVASPAFEGDTPYVTAVVDLGPVSLTGFVRGVDPLDHTLERETAVELSVETTETTGERAVAFRPVD